MYSVYQVYIFQFYSVMINRYYYTGSLAFQTMHLNKYWRFVLETWVTVHSAVVAFHTVPNIMGKELWPMFLFGFSTAIILTQVRKDNS